MENWVIKNIKADFHQIMKQFEVSEVLARCLVNKGLENPEEIEDFLNPKLEKLNTPYSMKDMKKACDILYAKVQEGKKIRIIGDYDVDGVVSTYILYKTLVRVGANVDYEIPDRIKDGYGINIDMVELAQKDGVDTILTCDNGISAIEPTLVAKELGMTMIVTDHHDLIQKEDGGVELPVADAILNPKQSDCNYPFPGLCGAAVAYKLALAFMEYYDIKEKKAFEEELLSFTAIATVCDVMDLTNENRIIVKYGIRLLKQTKNYGLLALMDLNGIVPEQLTTFHLGYILGPCLNASGRLDSAKKGLRLLLSNSEKEAIQLANEIKSLNDVRKDMTAKGLAKAIEQIEGSSLKDDKILVVYINECHESLAGIIAGRIKERYHKPAIVLTDSGEFIKGSARSIEEYHIFDELTKCKELLLKFGGHPMAAGLSILPCNINSLRINLNNNTVLTDKMLIPKVSIDALLPIGYINEELVEELKQLEPYGKGNTKPLFVERDLIIKKASVVGKNASGIRLFLENPNLKEMEAMYFGDVCAFFEHIEASYGKEEVHKLQMGRSSTAKVTVTYYPNINEYNGNKKVQLMIQNYR